MKKIFLLKEIFTIRYFLISLSFLFYLILSLKFYYLCNGDVVNFYPLISADGYDWYTEGIYLVETLKGHNFPNLPVLRNPFFVFITATDYLFGSKGIILSIVFFL
jgi:hypothetical protein